MSDEFKAPEAQRRSWRIQRVSWAIMGFVLLLALAGGLGHGWLSHTEARSADGKLRIGYDRIWRLNSTQSLEVEILSQQPDTIVLEIDAPFLSRSNLERVTPQPARTELTATGQRLVFAASGSGPAPVRLEVSARIIGRLRARIGTASGPPLTLRFFVLP